jgi:hypothetical protein
MDVKLLHPVWKDFLDTANTVVLTIRKKNLPLKRGDNLKIQKVSNSEKIQKVDVNVEKDCKQKMFC